MNKRDIIYIMRLPNSVEGLESMINYIDSISRTKEMNMIEIGSYAGESTLIFANKFKTILSIDPYINDYDKNDEVCEYADFDVVYKRFKDNTINFMNVESIRMKSEDAVSVIDKSMIYDFIYIDGKHTYDQVKLDIINYLPLISKDGFIGGHDYVPHWQPIINAVNEMVGIPDMIFPDDSWVKKISNL